MRNILHRNKWNAQVVEQHVKPEPNPMIKSKHDDNPDMYFVKLKL